MTQGIAKSDKEMEAKFADLIGPTDPVVDRQVRELLVTARCGLLLNGNASFFGNLATRMKLINADEWCATAATDGRNLYYNTRFINLLLPGEIEFLIAHEVLHCAYDHFDRRGERNPQLWNIANDYCVNGDLKKHGVGRFITSVPCLYDIKYDGMSSEQIYDLLIKNIKIIDLDTLAGMLLDDHLDGDMEGKDGRPQLTDEQKQAIKDDIKEAIVAAAQTSDAGNLPSGIKRLIQDLTEPRMNWRELLRMQLESTIKSDYTWMRASRRGWHMDAVMPGMKYDEMIDIAIMLDASGSIDNIMLKDFLSEVQSIMDTFPTYKITVGTFDTRVYNVQTYTSDNLDSIIDYEIKGGGGTDFMCIFKYLKKNEIEPNRLVIFTDMYPADSWGDPDYADTLFVAHGTTSIVAPYGVTAYYDNE